MDQQNSCSADRLFARERRGFVLTMVVLLFLPRVPLAVSPAQPIQSTLSLGFVALLYWAISCRLSPGWGEVAREKHRYAGLIQIVAVYQFAVTLGGAHVLSILYSAQWLLYVVTAAWLVGGYYRLAASLGRQTVLRRDLETMAVVYAVGLLLSLWTGPFYPHQVGWYERIGENFTIVSAVGFGSGKNQAGATLMMLAPFTLLPSSGGFRRFAGSFLVLAGLVATFSRGSLVGLMGGLLAVSAMGILSFLTGMVRVRRRLLIAALAVLIAGGIVAGAAALSIGENGRSEGYVSAAVSLLVPSSDSTFIKDLAVRQAVWREGLAQIADSGSRELVFGHGFRSASTIVAVHVGGLSVWASTHNSYIEFIFDFGIVGGLLMALWYLSTTWKCLSGAVWGERRWRECSTIAAIGMVSFAVLNLSETYFYSVELVVLMLAVAALPVLASECECPEPKEPSRAGIAGSRVADGVL